MLRLFALTLLCASFGRPASASDLETRRAAAGDALFTNPAVREIRIIMEAAAIDQLRRDTRAYVKANLSESGVTYTNIGIHLKGTGSFRPIDQKPAFTVKFNKFVEKQNFHGLTKISLNNAVQDPSYVNEKFCTELFRAAGVPAARVAHARVHLNDRYLGLYTLVEGLNKPFLRRYFSSAKGNLYEGHTKDVTDALDQDNGDDTSQRDLRALVEAARAPSAERWANLSNHLDLDRFLSMLAMEVLTAHWDGYWLNRNNYCIYNDPEARRMTFVPHGLDNMFQLPAMSWRPTMQGLLVRAVLHTPEGQRAYRERFRELLTNHFQLQRLTNRVDAIAAGIRPALVRDGRQAAKAFDENVADLKRRIAERVQNVTQQVATLGVLARFDRSGVAALASGWSTNVDAGIVLMTQDTENRKPVLRIKHGDSGGCVASWRKRVGLEGGRYRFRGRVKAEGLLPEGSPNVGVTLRISGIRPPFQITTDSDWRWVQFDFDVLPPSDDVDLICELSTVLGEVWFDLSSLQLERLR
ncbi:MAG: CotH kinase family protein [Verrucomicrobia subdivision 3 bacterium]|nr:CotH kinase family protein [Limisphaerales bacterium]